MVTEFTGNLLMKTLALKTCWQGGHQWRGKSHSNNGLTRGKRHKKQLQWTAFPLRFAFGQSATELCRYVSREGTRIIDEGK